jgi:AcrR family transcriptional regulator
MPEGISNGIDFGESVGAGRAPSARVRILQAFADRLREGGIREITMTDLANSLGMSKKTLYENFSNKEDILGATATHWVEGFRRRAAEAEKSKTTAAELVSALAMAHMDFFDCFSPQVWQELPRDYASIHARLVDALADANRQTRIALQDYLRVGVAPRVATETYLAMLARAADPEVCERVNLNRREFTMAALDIWSNGALQERLPGGLSHETREASDG